MNRWTGTAHLTRDPELVTTSGGTDICLMRIAVKRAARDGAAGYFDVKAFGDPGPPAPSTCPPAARSGSRAGCASRSSRRAPATTPRGSTSPPTRSSSWPARRNRDASQADNGPEPEGEATASGEVSH
jgi:Single-strand binding protein family